MYSKLQTEIINKCIPHVYWSTHRSQNDRSHEDEQTETTNLKASIVDEFRFILMHLNTLQ